MNKRNFLKTLAAAGAATAFPLVGLADLGRLKPGKHTRTMPSVIFGSVGSNHYTVFIDEDSKNYFTAEAWQGNRPMKCRLHLDGEDYNLAYFIHSFKTKKTPITSSSGYRFPGFYSEVEFEII